MACILCLNQWRQVFQRLWMVHRKDVTQIGHITQVSHIQQKGKFIWLFSIFNVFILRDFTTYSHVAIFHSKQFFTVRLYFLFISVTEKAKLLPFSNGM